MLADVGVFAEVSQELETEKDILIPIRAFGMSLVLNALSVSCPRGTEPSGKLRVVQMSREVESASRDIGDRYYCW